MKVQELKIQEEVIISNYKGIVQEGKVVNISLRGGIYYFSVFDGERLHEYREDDEVTIKKNDPSIQEHKEEIKLDFIRVLTFESSIAEFGEEEQIVDYFKLGCPSQNYALKFKVKEGNGHKEREMVEFINKGDFEIVLKRKNKK